MAGCGQADIRPGARLKALKIEGVSVLGGRGDAGETSYMGERSVRGVGRGLSACDHGGYNRAIAAEPVGARETVKFGVNT